MHSSYNNIEISATGNIPQKKSQMRTFCMNRAKGRINRTNRAFFGTKSADSSARKSPASLRHDIKKFSNSFYFAQRSPLGISMRQDITNQHWQEPEPRLKNTTYAPIMDFLPKAVQLSCNSATISYRHTHKTALSRF